MRKLFFGLLIILILAGATVLLFPNILISQQQTSQLSPVTLTAASQSPVSANVIGSNTQFYMLSWNVIGSLSACTIRVDSAPDNSTWGTGDVVAGQLCTSSGSFTSTAHTVNFVRINSNATITGAGSLVVTLTGFSTLGGGGGGSGTVSANAGVANELAIYTAAAGSTTVSADATLTDNGTTLTYTGANGLNLPNGTVAQPTLTFVNSLGNGLYSSASGTICFSIGSTTVVRECFNSLGTSLGNAQSITFSQTANGNGTGGVQLGVVGSGTTESFDLTGGTGSGLVNTKGACKPVAAIALTVSGTVVNICSWTLPNSAVTWSWDCRGTYSISTSTDTLSLGMSASVAPTTEVGNASINSTLTGTSTQSTTTASATGNQNILTGASVSAVTNIPWSSSGTIQATAVSGTFAITATITGTTPSGTINVGSSCLVY